MSKENYNFVYEFENFSTQDEIVFKRGEPISQIILKKYLTETKEQYEFFDLTAGSYYSKKFETFDEMINDLERILSLKKTITGEKCYIPEENKTLMKEKFKTINIIFERGKTFNECYENFLKNKENLQNNFKKEKIENVIEAFKNVSLKKIIRNIVIKPDTTLNEIKTFFEKDFILKLNENEVFKKEFKTIIKNKNNSIEII